jgi:hypothetical protein
LTFPQAAAALYQLYPLLINGLGPSEVAVAADALGTRGAGRASAAVRSETLASMRAGGVALEVGPATTDDYNRQPLDARDSFITLPNNLLLASACNVTSDPSCTEPDAHLLALAYHDAWMVLSAILGPVLGPSAAGAVQPVTAAINISLPTHAGRSAPLLCTNSSGLQQPCHLTLRMPNTTAIPPGARLACLSLFHADDSSLYSAQNNTQLQQLLSLRPLVTATAGGNISAVTCNASRWGIHMAVMYSPPPPPPPKPPRSPAPSAPPLPPFPPPSPPAPQPSTILRITEYISTLSNGQIAAIAVVASVGGLAVIALVLALLKRKGGIFQRVRREAADDRAPDYGSPGSAGKAPSAGAGKGSVQVVQGSAGSESDATLLVVQDARISASVGGSRSAQGGRRAAADGSGLGKQQAAAPQLPQQGAVVASGAAEGLGVVQRLQRRAGQQQSSPLGRLRQQQQEQQGQTWQQTTSSSNSGPRAQPQLGGDLQ